MHSLKSEKNDGQWIGKLFIFMFGAHLFNVCVVLLLTNLWVLNSYTLLDALNNSLSVLILNAIHLMGTKFFLKFIYSYHAKLSNDMDYLKFEMKMDEYEELHRVTTPTLLLNLVMSIVLLLMDKKVIQTVLSISSLTLCLFLTGFGIMSAIMLLGMAAKAKFFLRVMSMQVCFENGQAQGDLESQSDRIQDINYDCNQKN